jgi:hypothetical protein
LKNNQTWSDQVARALTDIRSLARQHTALCIKSLAGIVAQKAAPPSARVAAASELLDRGWGKSAAIHQVEGDIRIVVRQIIDNAGQIATDDGPEMIDVTPGATG